MIAVAGFAIRDKVYESHCTLVYRAVRNDDGRAVILKLLKDDFPLPQDIIRFKREFEVARRWDSPRLIKALGLHFVRNKPMIEFEDIGGESLALLAPKQDWLLPDLLAIAAQIAEGLAEIHAHNVIHKDINPSNIVYEPRSGTLRIIDFGIAGVLSREDATLRDPGALEGTLPYMSPEQTGRMSRALDYRSDFYSLGVTLYELFTGTLPFVGQDALEVVHQHLTQTARRADEVQPALPHQVADIIAKLMAKAAEDRYQSAWGVKADLERCLATLGDAQHIPAFTLGQSDTPDRFHLSQKHYGRDSAVAELYAAFSDVCGGSRELVLVSGYSGIGKTSLVHELYQPATQRRAYLIGGKFDQFQRNTPYTALVAAFRELVRQLLTESEARLADWRTRLLAALGQNGQVILDALPEMETIIGPQPAVETLQPREARNRFNLVFQHFIQVFCQPDHPLVIFLDDLQWADNATLALIEALMTDEHTHHLLILGAYRNNEVAPDHPLISRLDKLAAVGTPIRQIQLMPLALPYLAAFVADSLHCTVERAMPLARLVETKTGGNPFFVGQFLTALYQQGLIHFGLTEGTNTPAWQWDVEQVHEAGFTDNVIELLVDKLLRLPAACRDTLRVAACIGNEFALDTLAAATGQDIVTAYDCLQPAMAEGLILPRSALALADPAQAESTMLYRQLKFLHDRVQQAAYSMIEVARRPAVHLDIGRLLLAATPAANVQDRLFELVDHLNIGRSMMVGPAELHQLARLNLDAAVKAKGATAFAAAQRYVLEGMQAGGELWEVDYALAVGLYREGAELYYLNGDYDEAERLIEAIWVHGTVADRVAAYGQLVTQRTMLGRYEDAIAAAAQALRLLGTDFPSDSDVAAAWETELVEVEALLAGRPVMALLDLPAMTDSTSIMLMKIFMTVHTTIYFTGRYTLYSWVLTRMVALSVRHGNLPESAKGYASFGNTLAANLGRFEAGYDFGVLGVRLSERYRNQSLKCKTSLILSMFLNHWSHALREADVFDEEGQQAGMESGEFQFVGYILSYGRTHNRFHRGDDLAGIFAELGAHLRFSQKARHNLSIDNLQAAGRIMLALMGEHDLSRLYGEQEISEADFIASCLANRSQSALGFYHTTEAFRHYLLGDFVAARLALEAARPLLGYIKGLYTEAAFVFYESLLLLATFEADGAPGASMQRLGENQRLLANWAAHAPANFRHQHLLLEAELARVEGRVLDAMDGYDRAIEAALDAGFKQNEALAHELAGRFWLGRGKTDFAATYLERALQGYRAWGAVAKERALRTEFPQLRLRGEGERYGTVLGETTIMPARPASYLAESTRLAINNLDLASVLKASQAISGEIDLDSLLQRLLRILIESAGAASGCVLLERGEDLLVAAGIDGEGNVSREPRPLAQVDDLPQAIVQYVLRSGETLLLADAAREGLFTADPHVKRMGCRSLLCMPIRNGGVLIGILYLENRQTAGAFPPGRMGLLNILAAQAAISIQNALLYQDLVAEVELHRLAVAELRAKEAQYRAVFENAADGIFRVGPDGRLLLVNPALATMLGFSSATQMMEYAGQPGIGQFLPTEMQALLLQHFNRDGAIRNVEFRATRRDGTLLELLLTGHVARDEQGTVLYYEGVIQDVTARKRVVELKIAKEAAEAAARAKGEFLANMSHEIRTPMTAILGFSTLALRQEVPPRVRDYLCKIDKAGQSLLGVINDILDFSKMDAGYLQLEAIAFNLSEVLMGLHDLFAEQAVQKGIRYEVVAEPNVPNGLIGDPNRLNQILVNLVSNAVKFTERGAVTVRARADDQGDGEAALCFSVRDTGIGMSAENVDKLFQAFYQADTSTTRQYGGTGLGLTISRNLVELMGGNIAVQSKPGEGTEFTVTILFPIANANMAPQAFRAPPQLRDNPRGDRSWRVLLVEDNAINQQVATELLAGAGYNVEVASDGLEAVQQTEAADYDVVLMDIQMPVLDGYAATKRIRAGTRQPNVPIIAMTAHAIAGYREQCLTHGMNDYVSKPISPPELYKVLARWCTPDAAHTQPPKVAPVESPNKEMARFAGLAPHIDVAELWKHVAGKPGLLKRLLERFVESVESNDDTLRDALREGDLETASRLVHTVKGMAGTLGATDLRTLAIEFEAALEQYGTETSAEVRGRYFDCTRHLRLHVAQFLATQGE